MPRPIILHGDSQKDYACKLVREAPPGTVFRLSAPTRSNQQNALMWVWLNQLSKAKPEGREHSPEVWKAIFMQSFGIEARFAQDLDGNFFPIGHSTSALSAPNMADFLTFMQAEAATRWEILLEGKE